MKLDRTLAREIKAACGDGSRTAKFELLDKIKAAQRDLSTTSVRDNFNVILTKHGRAVTAICVATTLYWRQERIGRWGLDWADSVLDLWTVKPASGIDSAVIDDGLHPTRICEYAGLFIKLTTEPQLETQTRDHKQPSRLTDRLEAARETAQQRSAARQQMPQHSKNALEL